MMRKLLPLILLIISLQSFAQKGFYGGFSGNVGTSFVVNQNLYGIRWQHLSGDRTIDPAHRATFAYGAAGKIGYNFTPPLGFLVEGGFQKRGERFLDEDGKGVTHRKDIELNYVTTGIYFRYTSIFKKNHYKKEQKVRLAIVIGPQFNFLVSADQVYSLESEIVDLLNLNFDDIDYPSENLPFWTSDYDFTNQMDDKALFRSVDVGILGKIGVDIYPAPWIFISPMINSYLSITDINNKDFTTHSGYGQSRNLTFGFELGVGFYFEK